MIQDREPIGSGADGRWIFTKEVGGAGDTGEDEAARVHPGGKG